MIIVIKIRYDRLLLQWPQSQGPDTKRNSQCSDTGMFVQQNVSNKLSVHRIWIFQQSILNAYNLKY